MKIIHKLIFDGKNMVQHIKFHFLKLFIQKIVNFKMSVQNKKIFKTNSFPNNIYEF